MDMEQKNRWMSWVQNIVTLIFLPWAGWISAMIVAHSLAIAECKAWRENRPKFATEERMALAVMTSERDIQKQITDKLDTILERLNALDKRLSEHTASEKRNANP